MSSAAVLVIAASLLLHLLAIALTLFNLDSAEYGEGPLLAFVARWQREALTARWLSQVPVTTNAYGPLFFWGWKGLGWLLPSLDLLLVGRFLAFAGACAIGLIAARAAFQDTRSALAAAIVVLCLVSASEISKWFPYARVDTTASCLVALAYLLLGPSRPRLLATVVVIVVASTAKQTAAVHVIPLLAVAWATYGYRRAIEFSIAVTVAALALWVPIWAANEHYFWQATIGVHAMPWSLVQGYNVAYQYLITAGCVTALFALWLRVVKLQRLVLRDRWCLGFMWSLIVSSVLSLKAGSNTNYFIDAAWLGSVLIALEASELRVYRPRVATAGFAIAAALTLVPAVASLKHTGWPPTGSRQRTIGALVKQGAIIADGDLTAHVVRAGGSLLVSDPFLFSRLVDRGSHLDRDVIDHLSADSVAILSHPVEWHRESGLFWPLSVLQVLSTDFCLSASSAQDGLFIYHHAASDACRQTKASR